MGKLNGMKVHKLKILPEHFERVRSGRKRAELRFNDREFEIGDRLELCEWDGEVFTDRMILAGITDIIQVDQWAQGVKTNLVVLSIIVNHVTGANWE